MNEENRNEMALAIPLLLKIRGECCDGRTTINKNNLNDIAMNILKRLDLVVCKDWKYDDLIYYVGVSDKGRKVCRLIGAY